MTPDEKRAFANEIDKAIFHPMVEEVMEEFAFNMRFENRGLPKYGMRKIAAYAANVARAQALGIDLDDLRMTDEESGEAMMRMAQAAADAGKPVIVVTVPEEDQP